MLIDSKKYSLPYFHEREIWWCKIGQNIGYEINGKGFDFVRPVLIIKKFNKNMVLIAPLTTSLKPKTHSIYAGSVTGKPSQILLAQIRTIDTQRMQEKMARLDKKLFEQIKTAIRDMIAPTAV